MSSLTKAITDIYFFLLHLGP